MADNTAFRNLNLTLHTAAASTFLCRIDSIGDRLLRFYDNSLEPADHLHITDAAGISAIESNGLEASPGHATFSAPTKKGVITFGSSKGPNAIRVKPASVDSYVQFIGEDAAGSHFRYWESGKVDEGKPRHTIPREHLEIFDPHTGANGSWRDLDPQ